MALLALSLVWLVSILLPTATWFGNFTLNAYLTGIAALLAGSLSLFTLILFATKNPPQSGSLKDTPKSLIVVSLSGIPLLIYSVVSLGLNFRIEGFQNSLVWAAFSLTLLSLPFWLSATDAFLATKVLRVVVIAFPVTKIIAFTVALISMVKPVTPWWLWSCWLMPSLKQLVLGLTSLPPGYCWLPSCCVT